VLRASGRSKRANLTIAVTCRSRSASQLAPALARVARRLAAALNFSTGDLSVAIVGARAMATLHQRYAGVAGPTDVLTFDLGTHRRSGRLEGEIVICADVAVRQACLSRRLRRPRGAGATSLPHGCGSDQIPLPHGRGSDYIAAELALYLAHGLLHLSGYDDQTPAGFRRMHQRERELLRMLGLTRFLSPVMPV
jgi:probable rRNA maturation factor